MLCQQKGVLSGSDFYFFTPSQTARNLLFYFTSVGHFFCDFGYRVARENYGNYLLLLVKNPGKVFSIEQIYQNIWNEEAIGADNTVAVHIRHIREKIEINPKEPRYLKVVWGVGYKIEKQ